MVSLKDKKIGDIVYVIANEQIQFNPIKKVKIQKMMITEVSIYYHFSTMLHDGILNINSVFTYEYHKESTNLIFENIKEAKKYYKNLIDESDIEDLSEED